MEENFYTDEDNKTIDVKDLFADILIHWKPIICLGIVFALLLGVFSYIKSGNDAAASTSDSSDGTVTYTSEALQDAKNALSDSQIDNVEGIYAQYKSYQDNDDAVQQYFRDTSSFIDRESSPVMETVQYYITTDIQNIDNYYSASSLGLEDWGQIKQILKYGSDKSTTGLTDMVTFSAIDTTDSNNFIEINVDNGNSSDGGKFHMIMTVKILGKNQKQCDQVKQILDQGIQNATANLNKVGDSTTAANIASNYSDDIKSYLADKQQEMMDYSNKILNNISTLQNGPISNFSDDEQNYFDLLKARDEQKNDASHSRSMHAPVVKRSISKKYVVAGEVIGIVLGLLWAILAYLNNKTLKVPADLTDQWKLPVLNSYHFEKKTADPFKKWAARLRGRDIESHETKTAMLAEDIRIQAQKKGVNNIFVQRADTDAESNDIIQNLVAMLKEHHIQVISGDVFSGPQQLKCMAEADGVMVFAHLRATTEDRMNQYINYCHRYSSQILGAVTISDTPE